MSYLRRTPADMSVLRPRPRPRGPRLLAWAAGGVVAHVLAACAGDRVVGPAEAACASGPACASEGDALRAPAVQDGLADAGERLTPALTDAQFRADVSRALDALRVDVAAGRVVAARARLDALRTRLDRAPAEDAVEVDALRLALAPVAGAVGAPTFSLSFLPAE
jgi:hypothetical protein